MKRKASTDSRPVYQEGKEPPTLLTLPAELRELIYTFALVDSEPLIAYLAKRTIKRSMEPERQRRDDDHPRVNMARDVRRLPTTVRQAKAFPEPPHLTRVNRQLRRETLTVFWRDNVFLFNLDGPKNDEVQCWFEHSGIFSNTDRWTTLLEFTMLPIIVRGRLATVKITLTAERRLAVQFGGVLAEECTCVHASKAAEISETEIRHGVNHIWGVMYFASYMEGELVDNLRVVNRQWDKSWRCDDCGKIRCSYWRDE